MSQEESKNKALLKEGYELLECPYCDEECFPKTQKKNGTVVYTKHTCTGGVTGSFSINACGELVE